MGLNVGGWGGDVEKVVDGESAVIRQCWRREGVKNKMISFTVGKRPFYLQDPIKSN